MEFIIADSKVKHKNFTTIYKNNWNGDYIWK
jgi:hypothetical protein